MSSKLARDIYAHALEAVLPQNFMKQRCSLKDDIFYINDSSYNLNEYKNIYVFGSGKAAYSMAKEIEDILGEKIYKGLIVVPEYGEVLQSIKLFKGSHPIPTKESLESAQALKEMMQECDEGDLYIYLLSGGTSALIELPTSPITLEEFQQTTQLMLSNTLEIQEVNCVRKHISDIKGGRLAYSCDAQGVVLVLSDVIGDDLYAIGSAPLYADNTSFLDAKKILEEKNIYSRVPQSIRDVLSSGIAGEIEESVFKPLQRVSHHIVASNRHAKEAAKVYALSLGLSVGVIDESFHGEVSNVIKNVFEIVENSKEECIIFGGECTVNVQEDGQGGRNQHAVLLALQKMKEEKRVITFLSAGTDGIDGNSTSAGGVVDSSVLEKTNEESIKKYLGNCDSHNILKDLDALVTTGATGTNVIDLIIVIKGDTDV